MQRFAALFEELDTTNSTRAKVDSMARYFSAAPPADAAWAVYVLMGRRVKRSVGQALLHTWLVEEAALPSWLVQETYGSVGDLAETIALLVAPETPVGSAESLTDWFEARILPLRDLSPQRKRERVVAWWHELPYRECFLVNKLLTGALRVGVSRSLVTRALAQVLSLERAEVERALIGEWQPSAAFWEALARNEAASLASHPYPFFLASPLEGSPAELGGREAWLAEWKWDGIRGQVVRRAGTCTVWSRGEEVVTERFPEIVAAAAALPDGTVLDGEIVAWREQRVLPFSHLQQRIGRLKLSPKILKEVPAGFIVYDVLERDGLDVRALALTERRASLTGLLGSQDARVMSISPEITANSWEDLAALRATAREQGVEGLMLKRWDSTYGVGRQRGTWWKWKIDPFVFDGVLLYAAPGNGRRSNLYTDYTFGVWDGGALVPVAKAYSGLDNQEIAELDRWIRAHTVEKFGIVRSVEPLHVFELAYEGIARSKRHKSGIALRFPRILRWRRDKPVAEADTLKDLQRVLEGTTSGRAGEKAGPG
jgi:DNA ligase-1